MFLAVDIGGTKTIVASADGEGNIVERVQFATPQELGPGVEMIRSAASRIVGKSSFEAMGVAIGGPLSIRDGKACRVPIIFHEW